MKEQAPVVLEGYHNYYNLIRPHQTLKEKTPAEAAGMNLNLEENKWISLIKKATKGSN